MICKFSNVKYTLKNGVIKDIEKSNIFFCKTTYINLFLTFRVNCIIIKMFNWSEI